MPEDAVVVTEPAPAVDPPAAPEGAAAPPAAPESVEALPDWTQKLIRELRSEAAANRTKASAAEQTRQETMDAIAKALGLKGDDDPAAEVQKTAAQLEAERSVNRNLAVENAVLRMANKNGADPESLTDSRSFMRQLEAMDPAAADFASQVDAAIKEAVEKNPLLKGVAPAPPTPPARSGGPVGGGASVPGQLTEDDLKSMTPEEIVKAKADGRLNALLGITK